MSTRSEKQQEIVDIMEGRGSKKKGKAKAKAKPEPEGPRKYMGLPGTTLIGIGVFPMTVTDPEVQKRIEGSRSFKAGHVWIDVLTDRQAKAAEKLLAPLSYSQLRKLAVALGHRNVHRLNKLQLIEICTKDGASLL